MVILITTCPVMERISVNTLIIQINCQDIPGVRIKVNAFSAYEIYIRDSIFTKSNHIKDFFCFSLLRFKIQPYITPYKKWLC
ncbi:hypothetical protein C3995_00117 [Escherichia marmotae]|nr:hypothetical protein C4A11_00138 [Escherichia marmotae]RDR77934.1 hypothetical protein C4A00_00256 [Escherichia marmotae]RDS18610.1 hypothetical protein C3995_00117 [Escherichia marmotae]